MKRCFSNLLIVFIFLLTSCGLAEVDVEGNINSSAGQSTEAAEEVALPELHTVIEGNKVSFGRAC